MPIHDVWYKNAVFYELHVKAFYDGNGDGIGDFSGLMQKLEYLHELGVDCIWLLPFYDSPFNDDGYDIADFYQVHPRYGTLREFKAFLRKAHAYGIRVIADLIINHTSIRHPWFERARRSKPGSVWHNFYVWSDTPVKYQDARIIFTDSEVSNWTWDPVAGAYYWHRFFSHQPDLNFRNPAVERAMFRVVRYWLDMGLDGFRVDAVPYLYEQEGTDCENLPETHAFFKRLRRMVDERYGGTKLLMAEANQWPEEVCDYFGAGDEFHMAFHFPLMPRIFMALRQADRTPIVSIVEQTPPIPPGCQWGLFLRNHDELTLEMVTEAERDFMWQEYAADPQMRINLGIRRRLAPLLENNRQRIELLHCILLTMPGSPVLYYGDELGMGDNISLPDRDSVRTPMQWTAERNAGFSTAPRNRLYSPAIDDAVYGYQMVNYAAQREYPSSLLNCLKRLISVRKRFAVFGHGAVEFLSPANPHILAYVCSDRHRHVLIVANLAATAQAVDLDLHAYAGSQPRELLGDTPFPPISQQPYRLTLGPYGYYWFDIGAPARASQRPSARQVATHATTQPRISAIE